jgi:hypothetical protein
MLRTAIYTLCFLAIVVGSVRAEDEFERPPIEYSRSTPDNVVSRLQSRLERGEARLKFDEEFGYLPALLESLQIPVESQMLVFSKTSMQRSRISPQTPRAIYFSDDAYVGFCRAGNVLEVSAADPQLGAVFYTLEQKQVDSPVLLRRTQDCLLCHSSSQAGGVPSHLVRSVFVDASGLPLLSEGSFRVDHGTPLENRWGGWYVTGRHGAQAHLGNLIVRDLPLARPIQNAAGHNVESLQERFPTAGYLTPHSDIVALMVLEHQTLVHNVLTQANFTARQALQYEAEFNASFKEPPTNRLESTTRRIASAGDRLVKGLLFAGEAPLTAPISGTSGFAQRFVEGGPRDQQGRSLRDFDLTTRMFKYPCSYLIYSDAFDGLPREMKSYVAVRLREVLLEPVAGESPRDQAFAKEFAHLSADDRRAIAGILRETKPGFLEP